jgi:hypothetical protein
MILIHLDKIEHAYDKIGLPAVLFDQAMDSSQWSASVVNVPVTWPFQRAERYDLIRGERRR